MPASIQTLEQLICDVLRQVKDFVEEACCIEADPKDFQPWNANIREMMQSTRNPSYICEENLEVLMNFQISFTKLWTDLQTTFREREMDRYNNFQMQMNSIISRMQLKILLQHLERLHH